MVLGSAMEKRRLSIILFLFLFISIPAAALAWPLPDTDQIKCYNGTGEISCPQPGEPFHGQDAQYTINPPSYTKLDASGNDLPDDGTM
jgi:hypothetical protein